VDAIVDRNSMFWVSACQDADKTVQNEHEVQQQGSVCVHINYELGHFFQTRKGLVADMLAVLIEKAKSLGFFEGLVPHLVDDGLSILQYADDTILFIEDDLVKAKGLRLVLSAFEKLSGLKINFHRSELFCFGEANNKIKEYIWLFGCKEGAFPFRYLGIPMSPRKLSNGDWRMVEERFKKKLSSWKGKML
jgi:hypothetical protein